VYYFVFLVLLQASGQQAGVPLIEDCSDSATVLATLPAGAPVEVRSAVAGYDRPCYAVTAVVSGKSVRGYVQGSNLDAVAEFERLRAAADAAVVNGMPLATPEPAPAVAATASIPVEKIHYPPFANFSALDMKGKSVSVRSMKGKVNLICFWAPRNQNSSRELLTVTRLYGEFKKLGVDALAVSLSSDRPLLKDALDDFQIGFRNVPNGYEIAAKYNIDYESLPRTYVLNEDFEVVASGLHDKALEALVKKLMAAK
jgi:hypothetical protein